MNLTSHKINQIADYFQNQPVLKAYLFGSYVRGDATLNSDIDLLVELDYSEKIGLNFIQMQLDLEDILHSKVDLVSERGVSKYLLPVINLEKKLIYEK